MNEKKTKNSLLNQNKVCFCVTSNDSNDLKLTGSSKFYEVNDFKLFLGNCHATKTMECVAHK